MFSLASNTALAAYRVDARRAYSSDDEDDAASCTLLGAAEDGDGASSASSWDCGCAVSASSCDASDTAAVRDASPDADAWWDGEGRGGDGDDDDDASDANGANDSAPRKTVYAFLQRPFFVTSFAERDVKETPDEPIACFPVGWTGSCGRCMCYSVRNVWLGLDHDGALWCTTSGHDDTSCFGLQDAEMESAVHRARTQDQFLGMMHRVQDDLDEWEDDGDAKPSCGIMRPTYPQVYTRCAAAEAAHDVPWIQGMDAAVYAALRRMRLYSMYVTELRATAPPHVRVVLW